MKKLQHLDHEFVASKPTLRLLVRCILLFKKRERNVAFRDISYYGKVQVLERSATESCTN